MPGVEDLKGITKKAKNSLLDNGYDTLEKIAKATKEELTKLPFIGEKTAEKILTQVKELLEDKGEEKTVETTDKKPTDKITEDKEPKRTKPKKTIKTRETKKKKSKQEKPKVILQPNQLLGHIIAIRSSSSGIRHPSQGIVRLVDKLEIEPAILVGKKVKATYPSGKEIRGKVVSIFGKKTTKKFIVRFNRNISGELLSREVILA